MKVRIGETLASLIAVGVFISMSGCADRKNISPIPSIKQDVKTNLGKQIDCSTAKHDIQILEDEKASVGKRMLSGVRSVFPIAAVAGVLMGDYSDRVAVTTGQYNDDIEKRVEEIKTTCGLSGR